MGDSHSLSESLLGPSTGVSNELTSNSGTADEEEDDHHWQEKTDQLSELRIHGEEGGGPMLRQRQNVSKPRVDFDILDHFSLRSSLFRHRGKIVITGARHQLIFEREHPLEGSENRNNKLLISVRRASLYGGWMIVLKLINLYIILFLVCAVVVFSVLVFMQYGLGVFLVGIRLGNLDSERFATVLTAFAIPTFVAFLSQQITILLGFLSDAWNDYEFFNSMTIVTSHVRDWILATAIFILPFGTLAISMLSRSDSPVTSALMCSLLSMAFLFFLTQLYTIWLEAYSCIKITQACNPEVKNSWMGALGNLFGLRIQNQFALTFRPGDDPKLVNLPSFISLDELESEEYLGPGFGTKPVLGKFSSYFFEEIHTPQRIWTLQNVLKPRPIMSRKEGLLLFLWCFKDSRFRGRIRSSSVRGSFYCIAITVFLAWFLLLGYLVYVTFIPNVIKAVIACFAALMGLIYIRSVYKAWQEFKLRASNRDVERARRYAASRRGTTVSTNPFEDEDDEEEEQIEEERFRMDERIRTPINLDMDEYARYNAFKTRQYIYAFPKIGATIFFVSLYVCIFFLVPFYAFSYLGVHGYGGFFFTAWILSWIRYLFDIRTLIQTYGPKAIESLELPMLDFMEANRNGVDDDEDGERDLQQQMETQEDLESQQQQQQQEMNFERASLGSSTVTTDTEHHVLGTVSSPKRQAKSARLSRSGRRVYLLLTRMTKEKVRTFWLTVLGLASLTIVILVAVSVDLDTTQVEYEGAELFGNFTNPTHYTPTESHMERGFLYPSCNLFDDFLEEFIPKFIPFRKKEKAVSSLLDFVYFADLAYTKFNTTQLKLDEWFGPNEVTYIPPENYTQYARVRESSAVFKLFHMKRTIMFQEHEAFVLSIRGTINTYDLLSDMQNWFAAMLFQMVRFALPFGSLWNDVVPWLIKYYQFLETSPAEKLSYEADISKFLDALKERNPSAHVTVVGHSLGGGLAMIVGAKKKIPAVGISGPNMLLSRLKFGLRRDEIDRFTINIIPHDDPIPWVDDQALLTESIKCRAPSTDYLGACHQLSRTLCEIQTVCGSAKRPPLKICNSTYEYPDPLPI